MKRDSIAAQFERVALRYEQEASPQRIIAEHLATLLPEGANYRHAFEMGAGTGLLTHQVDQRCHVHQWTLNDLSDALLQQIAPLKSRTVIHEVGDAQQLILRGRGIDLFLSASAIQWLPNPIGYVRSVIQQLAPRATCAIATFGPDNLHELRSLTQRGLDYPSLLEWHQMLRAEGGHYLLHDEQISMTFPTVSHLLRHLHDTGTSRLPGREPMLRTPSQLRIFAKQYQSKYTTSDGLISLTYHPIYIIITHR